MNPNEFLIDYHLPWFLQSKETTKGAMKPPLLR